MNRGGKAERNSQWLKLVWRLVVFSSLIVLAAVVTVIYFQQKQEFDRLAKNQARLLAERDRLLTINRDLQNLEALTGTDTYWERIARDQLGLVRPDEIIIRID